MAALARLVLTLFRRSTVHLGQTVVRARPVELECRGTTISARRHQARAGLVGAAVGVLAPMARRGPVVPVKFMGEFFPKWANTATTAPTASQAKMVPPVPPAPMVRMSAADLHLPLGPGVRGAAGGRAVAVAVLAEQVVEAVGAVAAPR